MQTQNLVNTSAHIKPDFNPFQTEQKLIEVLKNELREKSNLVNTSAEHIKADFNPFQTEGKQKMIEVLHTHQISKNEVGKKERVDEFSNELVMQMDVDMDVESQPVRR